MILNKGYNGFNALFGACQIQGEIVSVWVSNNGVARGKGRSFPSPENQKNDKQLGTATSQTAEKLKIF